MKEWTGHCFDRFWARKTRETYTENGIWGVNYAAINASIILEAFLTDIFCEPKMPAMGSCLKYAAQIRRVHIPLEEKTHIGSIQVKPFISIWIIYIL